MISCSQAGMRVLMSGSLIFPKCKGAAFSMLLVDVYRSCFCSMPAQKPGFDPGGNSGGPVSAGHHFHVSGSLADQQSEKLPESH